MFKEKLDALLKNDKAVRIIFFIGAALIVVIALSSFFETENLSVRDYTQKLEQRLGDILSEIDGAGSISVMITLEDIDDNSASPRVRGAMVVCEGSDNIIIRQKIVDAVSKVLGISTARVAVIS